MSTIEVRIVSAEQEIFSGAVSAVFAPAEMGEVGIFPQHAPLLTRLKPGDVRIRREDGEDRHFFVSGGILEVQPFMVTVLTDTVLRGEDLDEARAQQAKERAEETLRSKLSGQEAARALAELAEAAAQLRMIEELRKQRR